MRNLLLSHGTPSRSRSTRRVAAFGSGIGLFCWDTPQTLRQGEHSIERVLRHVFWRVATHRPLGTLSSLADARAKKILQSQR
jgi:hypothetical protein